MVIVPNITDAPHKQSNFAGKCRKFFQWLWGVFLGWLPIIIFVGMWYADIPRKYIWVLMAIYLLYVCYLMRGWFEQVFWFGQLVGKVWIERYIKKK